MAIELAPSARSLPLARLARLALLVLGAPLLGACNTFEMLDGASRIEGSGTVIEEARQVGDFTRIDVGGAITADVTVGPDRALTIRSDDNILALYETVVQGETLHIRPKAGSYAFQPTDGIHVTIAMPELQGVVASGASTVAVDRVTVDDFDVEASGAAHVTIGTSTATDLSLNASGAAEISVAGGTADAVVANLSGASSLDALDLKAERVTLDFSGTSHGQVNAIDALDVSLSGGSSACYAGKPADIESEVSGGASLDPCP